MRGSLDRPDRALDAQADFGPRNSEAARTNRWYVTDTADYIASDTFLVRVGSCH